MTMQAAIPSPFHQITLHFLGENLEAEVKSSTIHIHFTSGQIRYGIMENRTHQELIRNIHLLGTAHLAAFPFPKKNPAELWIFEAARFARLLIRQGKEELRQADCQKFPWKEEASRSYKKALQQLQAALSVQRLQKGEAADLEQAIKHLQRKQNVLKWTRKASFYLPDEKELKRLEALLETCDDEIDIQKCFQKLVESAEHSPSPYAHWLAAWIYESQGDWQKAKKAYLQLAENNPCALACMDKVYEMARKSQLVSGLENVWKIFAESLIQLQTACPFPSPTCLICFNPEEEDVKDWLATHLVPDLKLAGINPIFSCSESDDILNLGHSRKFAKQANLMLLVCTPAFKDRHETREQASVKVKKAIFLIQSRYQNRRETIFPIFLKGTAKHSIPADYVNAFCHALSSNKPFNCHYFTHCFEIIAAMRQVSEEKAGIVYQAFAQKIKAILQEQDKDYPLRSPKQLTEAEGLRIQEKYLNCSNFLQQTDWYKNKSFEQLIGEHKQLGLGYILAVVLDENSQLSFYDGCQLARIQAECRQKGWPFYNPRTEAKICNVYYYLFIEKKFQFLFTGKDLNQPLYWNYLFANDSTLTQQARSECLFQLGSCYYQGQNAARNVARALIYFRQAVQLDNHPRAAWMIAYCYENGEGLQKNEEKAWYWYAQAKLYAQQKRQDKSFQFNRLPVFALDSNDQ